MSLRVRHHLDNRLFEWTFSICSLWLGLSSWFWPRSITSCGLQHMTDVVTVETMAAYALGVGFVGTVALVTNGYTPLYGPVVRSVCSIGRALLWCQFSYALALMGEENGFPPVILGFWILFTTGELCVAYRAMTEAARDGRSHSQRDL